MPDPYVNPNKTIPSGGYLWVPNVTPNGGATPIGFRPTIVGRGQFRNDLPVQTDYPNGSVVVTYDGELISLENSENWPFLNAFRPLQRPSAVRGAAPNSPFIVSGTDWKWQVDLKTPTRLSAATFTYSLTVDVQDDSVFNLIDRESDDGRAILAYRSNPSQSLDIDWSKYIWGRVDVDDIEFPPLVEDKPSQIAVTGIQSTTDNQAEPTTTVTIKFGTGLNAEDYQIRQKLTIKNRHEISALKFSLHEILLFDAARVNLIEEQLPCALLSYAFPVAFNYSPSRGSLVHPNNLSTPNFHVKLFHPESNTNSPGFAHSMSVRFLLFSMPISGIDPFSFFGVANPFSLYFVVFIGPVPGKRTLRYGMIGKYSKATAGRVVPVDYFTLQQNARIFKIQKTESEGRPSDNATWTDVDNGEYDPQNIPAFDPIRGPWLRHFTYYDDNGDNKSWYRVIQTLSTGNQFIGPSFQGSLFSERLPLRMVDSPSTTTAIDSTTLIRRIQVDSGNNPLNSNPLALFVAVNEDRPPADPVNFVKGSWKLSLRAACPDPNYLSYSHLYARIWFVPEDHNISETNIHEYRDKTEICFETSDGQTKLVRRAPRSLSELMVSPPLPQSISDLEIARYIDVDTSFNFNLGSRAKMVAGLYEVTALSEDGISSDLSNNDYDLPKINIEINAESTAVDTTLQQTLSQVLYPQRASNFDSSRYIIYPKPLVVSTKLVGGSEIPSGNDVYTEYNKTFASKTDNNSNITNAFDQLLTFVKSGQDNNIGKVGIPFENVPQQRDPNLFVVADFVTNDLSLQAGKIDTGPWSIVLRSHRSIDNERIAIDIRLEAMLVTTDGRVSERIFRSPYIKDRGQEEADYVYDVDLQIPFLIGNSDTQMVLRVYAYPYSRSGQLLDINAIKSSLNNLSGIIPFGLRIQELTIIDHTINRLEIDQIDSVLGSPAFYEDLPLVPNRTIGDQEFWFIAANDLLTTRVVDGLRGLDVTGCIYSPTWFVNLPKDIEVRSGAQGFRDRLVWFRTVPAEGDNLGEFAVSALENPTSGRIHVVQDGDPEISSQSFNSMNATGKIIKQYSFDAPYLPLLDKGTVQGPNGNGFRDFEGKNPSIVMMPTTMSGENPSLIALVAQADDSESSFNVALNARSGLVGSWIGPNRELGESEFGKIRKVAQGMFNPSVAISNNGVSAYVAGWVNPGTIVLKQTNLFDARKSTTIAEGLNFIIDGDPNPSLGSGQRSIIPRGSLSGKATQTFPAIMIDDREIVTIAYAIDGESGKLFARRFDGYNVSNKFLLADLRAQGTAGNDTISIFGPALAWNKKTHSAFMAWWCGGKIFAGSFSLLTSDSSQSLLTPIQLVAGNRDFTSSGNSAHASFIALKSNGSLRVDQLGTPEQDVPRQRVGLFVSQKFPHQGNLFIWYRDSEGNLRMREVMIGGVVGAPTIYSQD